MELHPKQTGTLPEKLTEDSAWQPEVLNGVQDALDLPSDFDLAEVWYWFHSRLKALGDLNHDDARLTALMNWNGGTVGDALHAARLHVNQLDEESAVRQVHMEFLTAEYLARHVLEKKTIPSTALRPA